MTEDTMVMFETLADGLKQSHAETKELRSQIQQLTCDVAQLKLAVQHQPYSFD